MNPFTHERILKIQFIWVELQSPRIRSLSDYIDYYFDLPHCNALFDGFRLHLLPNFIKVFARGWAIMQPSIPPLETLMLLEELLLSQAHFASTTRAGYASTRTEEEMAFMDERQQAHPTHLVHHDLRSACQTALRRLIKYKFRECNI
jgi:hypothetical protein